MIQSLINQNYQENHNKIAFKAGKIKVFSDFDGTFCNFSHENICKLNVLLHDEAHKSFFDSFYAKFREIQELAAKKFEFTVTTGRNRQEYNYFVGKIRQQGKDIPTPQKLITRDGADIFHYNGNSFESSNVDTAKRAEIHKLTNGWNGREMKGVIKGIITELHDSVVHFIDAPVNKHEYDYGEISLESILNSLEPKKRKNYVSFRDDGELSFHITGSPNVNLDNVAKRLEKYFSDNKIKAGVFINEQDFNAIIPVYDESNRQVGLIPTRSLVVRPVINDRKQETLTKLFDLRKAVKEVVKSKSDDLVIFAGDDVNDIDSLNPLNYVDLIGLPIPKPHEYDGFIERHRKKIQSLPLVSIVAENNPNLNMLRDMAEKINGEKTKKIICVNNSDEVLADGIKEGIISYANQNAIFASNLPRELQAYLGLEPENRKSGFISSLFSKFLTKGTDK